MTKRLYYFHECQDLSLGTDGLFEFANRFWYFKMEVDYGEGIIRIYDSAGRMLPLDSETVDPMLGALTMVCTVQEELNHYKALDPKSQLKDMGFTLDGGNPTLVYPDASTLQ
jgi:hypothetical protein